MTMWGTDYDAIDSLRRHNNPKVNRLLDMIVAELDGAGNAESIERLEHWQEVDPYTLKASQDAGRAVEYVKHKMLDGIARELIESGCVTITRQDATDAADQPTIRFLAWVDVVRPHQGARKVP